MPPKVTEAYKEERRACLLEHATVCFFEKGYADTTIDDIVGRSKMSKGAIYNYFRSKEEIFLQLLTKRNAETLAHLRELFRELSAATEKLQLLLHSIRRIPDESESRVWGMLHLEFLLYASRQPDLQHLIDDEYDKYMAFYEEIMNEGREKGEFRADLDPHLAASIFWKLMNGIALQFGLMNNERLYDQTLREAEAMLLQYVKGGTPE